MKDKYEVVVYSAHDGVHADFIKQTDKKTAVISLNEEQYRTLQFVRPMISKAAKKREDFQYDLGGNVRLAHEKYRKIFYVVIRQWYTDDKGDLQPSLYGVNIPCDVWKHHNKGGSAGEIGKYMNHN